MTAMSRLCLSEHHFLPIDRILYIISSAVVKLEHLSDCHISVPTSAHMHWFSHSSPPHYVNNIHNDCLSAMWFNSRWWTWISESHLHLSSHPCQWHSILSWLLPRRGFSGIMHGFGPGTPGRCVTDLGDWSTSYILSYHQNDDCNVSLGCSQGMVWQTYKTLYSSSHQHQYQRLCNCKEQVPLWCPSTETQVGRWYPSLSLMTSNLKGAPPQFHMALRDLGDAQLWQLMEDLWQEAAQRIDCIPHRATLGPLEGSCRSSWCWPQRWGSDPSRGRGWGPSKPPAWSAGPLQIEEDVGCLFSTLVAGLRLGTPKN